MNKKADVQIQETIVVIFVFMILLAFGLIFFSRYLGMQVQELSNKDKIQMFYGMSSTFPGLPEIKCSSYNEEAECIDILKLIAYKDKGDFGFMNITVYQVYPSLSNGHSECNLNTLKLSKNCTIYSVYNNILPSYTSKERLVIPISLYDPLSNTYDVGKAVLERYS